MQGVLYVVATPIGNLEDITLRALRVLKEVDAIACEDTRVSSKLLKAYDITKPCIALHQHTTVGKIQSVITRIKTGASIAYLSDAGTPGLNDPGGKLVEAALQEGIAVIPLPGASAITAIISTCGFPMDEFVYSGFLPHKKGRQTLFREMAERRVPTIVLESTHRIQKTLTSLKEVLQPDREICVGRELTKLHETIYRGTVSEVEQALQSTSFKGEFILVIGPYHS